MPPKRHRPAHSEAAPAPFSSSSVSSFIPSSIRAINPHQISTAAHDLWKSYLDKTPNSLMIIDAFLIFLMYVGAVQFAYAVLTGGYPFNSFLAGFAAAVGQFVLAASLRSQVDKANRAEFPEVTPEKAFGDFVFSSIVLHFFVVTFLG